MTKFIINNIYKTLPNGYSGQNYVINYKNSLYTVKKYKNIGNLFIAKNEYNALMKLNKYFPTADFPKPFKLILKNSEPWINNNFLLYDYINGSDSRYLINLFEKYQYHINYHNLIKPNLTTPDDQNLIININNQIFINNLIKLIKKYILDIAKLIEICHSIGLTHLDIKPENILLSNILPNFFKEYKTIKYDNLLYIINQLYLIDFGFVHPIKYNNKELIKINKRVGTIKYVSPEMLAKTYNCTSDIFSLGKILDEIIISTNFFLKHNNQLDNARSLCNDMLIENPLHRMTITDVINNKWLNNTL